MALVRKGGLWAVLELGCQARQVETVAATAESNFEAAIQKAIRLLAQSVRR